MRKQMTAALLAACVVAIATDVRAQQAAAAAPGQAAAQPAATVPPLNSPTLLRFIRLQFPTQGNASVIEPQTYLYYIQTRPSRPSDGVWVPYNEQSVLEDFKRLWATNF
ncbi:MAG: hypothetical protein Q7V01_14460, partial [Vicinamibacterales bacterium]|nr:hypothetical protein [Vicinamibacterales bacterium]